MKQIWTILLFQPFINGLIFLYQIFGNLGVAIILLTVLIRMVLYPLTLPSMKAAKKMAELAPEIEKLKKQHKDDRQKLASAQMSLYAKHGANPAAGCLPQIIQLIILIALYQAFAQVLRVNGGEMVANLNHLLYPFLKFASDAKINLSFLYLDLGKPDLIRIPGLPPLPGPFLLAAALVQLISSKMMSPQVAASQKQAFKTKEKTDDIATTFQSQALYLFPLMTIVIGFTFPSGLVLYWFTFSATTAIQQYFVSGLGGLEPWLRKIRK